MSLISIKFSGRVSDHHVTQAETTAKLAEVRKEKDFLKTLSDSMLRDQAAFKQKLAAAEEECAARKTKTAELEDQVHFGRATCLKAELLTGVFAF